MLYIRVILSLVSILILIYVITWALSKKKKLNQVGNFTHLGAIPLGPNKTIQVVEIGNKIYILGVGEDVRLIQIIEENEDIKAIKKVADIQPNRIPWLRNISIKKKGLNDENYFERELAEKIEQLKVKRIQSVNKLFDLKDEKRGISDQHEEV
ncbi:hypothetical protein BHF71_00450 [Vulcanibacillus modesticaldus]|uniref:Flagellar protein n=1 Tax=Vulcanibacillus modesticaldus TaxID=337097 RepID=A0A1D2YXL5_9BACI|nr:flagellar biosynthetic protein FliO [Vulcanibacillus modesticaldus]OEG00413.1 hypothetical protein BHF71_00450 [Vulcanibacillus modesticaldus]